MKTLALFLSLSLTAGFLSAQAISESTTIVASAENQAVIDEMLTELREDHLSVRHPAQRIALPATETFTIVWTRPAPERVPVTRSLAGTVLERVAMLAVGTFLSGGFGGGGIGAFGGGGNECVGILSGPAAGSSGGGGGSTTASVPAEGF